MMIHYKGTPDEMRALGAYIKLMRASETVLSEMTKHTVAASLTISQLGTLEALHHLGPIPQKDIAKKILKSSGNITTVVDNLEREKLVHRVRDTRDRRFVYVHLTAEGRRVVQQYFPTHVEEITRLMSVLTPDEQDTLAAICKKLGIGIVGA
ncbi:MAG: MarR family transcriptional regulator [Deltaproteobacteria bacterium]|nr:MarR family transcriptional regulator [Deltaproteobacteria bacterium]